jgi:hypothetical protein
MKKIIALVTAAVFSFGLGVVYAEDEVKMPWENMSKSAVSTKEKTKDTNKDKGKKVAKNNKEKKTDKEKKKKVTEKAK